MPNVQQIHPMDELKQCLKRILEVIPQHSKIFYIDYPVHSNCGDLLIMKGTEAFFKDHQIQVIKRFSVYDFNERMDIPDDHILVLHGGGNFGDLYEMHQKLREKIVETYPNHRIVLLPQTVYYQSEEALQRTVSIFNKHSDLHLYLRDEKSFQLVSEHFLNCKVRLMPDMAHQLWPIQFKGVPNNKRLNFLRMDIEADEEQFAAASQMQDDTLDWHTLYNRYERKLVQWAGGGLRRIKGSKVLQLGWKLYSDYLVNKAIRRFAKYETIYTSRLHGHILSCLMDKPNVLIDNSYGKNSGYYLLWTYKVNMANMAGTVSGRTSGEQNYRETHIVTV
ncbi:polysaccharide pyruvyl transferase family protein [Paenibacillus sp. TC-CSREp1]|uniref:polysaccharide pyruvyl transferase family protein n=1 Tax=Paenibacillus sp. TC-CSREp1 TaxID=3410089 RepID=UPI003D01F45A